MRNDNFKGLGYLLLLVLIFVGIILYIILMVKYANTPVGELPVWVAWILFDNNK